MLVDIPAFGALTAVVGELLFDVSNARAQSPFLSPLSSDKRCSEVDRRLECSHQLLLAHNQRLCCFFALSSLQTRVCLQGHASLTSVQGFAALQSAGSVSITSNTALTTLPLWNSLTRCAIFMCSVLNLLNWCSAFYLHVIGNPALVQLSGFQALVNVTSDIDVHNNNALTNITCCNALQRTGSNVYFSNAKLVGVAGFGERNCLNSLRAHYLLHREPANDWWWTNIQCALRFPVECSQTCEPCSFESHGVCALVSRADIRRWHLVRIAAAAQIAHRLRGAANMFQCPANPGSLRFGECFLTRGLFVTTSRTMRCNRSAVSAH